MVIDWLCHDLTCSECGSRPASCDDLGMQVHLAVDGRLRQLHVGDRIVLPRDLVDTGNHIQISEHPEVGSIELWVCPTCAAWQWARVTLQDEVITAIEAVALDSPSLESTRYISTEVGFVTDRADGARLDHLPLAERRALISTAAVTRQRDRAIWFTLDLIAGRQPIPETEVTRILDTERHVVPPGTASAAFLEDLLSRGLIERAPDGLRILPPGETELASYG